MKGPHFVVRRATEHNLTTWKNGHGTTAEIAKSPNDATIENFDWRVSMATIVADGAFSQFEGIERGLMVLDGKLQLAVNHSPAAVLTSKSAPLRFPGESPVFAALPRGVVLDLNVMTRRGRFEQSIERRSFSGEIQLILDCEVCVLVSRAEDISVRSSNEAFLMGVNDALIVHPARVSVVLAATRSATIIAVHIDVPRS